MNIGIVLIGCWFVKLARTHTHRKHVTSFNESTQLLQCNRILWRDVSVAHATSAEKSNAAMTKSEKLLLAHFLSSARFYFEYGCGGSTSLACRVGVADLQVVSADSSQEWLAKVSNDSCITANHDKYKQVFIDLGAIGILGFPNSTDKISDWHQYSSAIHPFANRTDLVLIDGRFRVASALKSLMATSPGTPILFHDFFGRRGYYPVLKYTDIIGCAEEMVVLQLKDGADLKEMRKELMLHVNNPA